MMTGDPVFMRRTASQIKLNLPSMPVIVKENAAYHKCLVNKSIKRFEAEKGYAGEECYAVG
jgi:hypothetical protein